MAVVGSVLPWIEARFFLNDTVTPNAGGFVEFFNAGLNTHKHTYAQADLDPGSVNANPVQLDSDGRAVIFLELGAYDVTVKDANSVLLYSWAGVEDFGATTVGNLGTLLNGGARSVTSGYTVLATDLFITVNSGAGATVINLPPAANHPQPLGIKNTGTNTVAATPNGTETIELGAAGVAYSMPAAAAPNYPTIWLTNDAISAWFIMASHGL